MNSNIDAIDKLIILSRTGMKLLRGGGTQSFLERSAWDASSGKRRTDVSR